VNLLEGGCRPLLYLAAYVSINLVSGASSYPAVQESPGQYSQPVEFSLVCPITLSYDELCWFLVLRCLKVVPVL